jgi:hypothetical protein
LLATIMPILVLVARFATLVFIDLLPFALLCSLALASTTHSLAEGKIALQRLHLHRQNLVASCSSNSSISYSRSL